MAERSKRLSETYYHRNEKDLRVRFLAIKPLHALLCL